MTRRIEAAQLSPDPQTCVSVGGDRALFITADTKTLMLTPHFVGGQPIQVTPRRRQLRVRQLDTLVSS